MPDLRRTKLPMLVKVDRDVMERAKATLRPMVAGGHRPDDPTCVCRACLLELKDLLQRTWAQIEEIHASPRYQIMLGLLQRPARGER